jgi:hypothetical protein
MCVEEISRPLNITVRAASDAVAARQTAVETAYKSSVVRVGQTFLLLLLLLLLCCCQFPGGG